LATWKDLSSGCSALIRGFSLDSLLLRPSCLALGRSSGFGQDGVMGSDWVLLCWWGRESDLSEPLSLLAKSRLLPEKRPSLLRRGPGAKDTRSALPTGEEAGNRGSRVRKYIIMVTPEKPRFDGDLRRFRFGQGIAPASRRMCARQSSIDDDGTGLQAKGLLRRGCRGKVILSPPQPKGCFDDEDV